MTKKGIIFQIIFRCTVGLALLGLVACGTADSESVKARPLAPPTIEAKAMSWIHGGGSVSSFSTSVVHPNALNPNIVSVSRNQIRGLRMQVVNSGGSQVRVQLEVVESLMTGCRQGNYVSQVVSEDRLEFDWTPLAGGDMKVRCLDSNCNHILLVIDRFTGGDPGNPLTQGVLYQAGSVVMARDPNNPHPSAGVAQFIPSVTRDRSLFLDANDTPYEKQICQATFGSESSLPANPFEGTIPPSGTTTPYHEPFPNNTIF